MLALDVRAARITWTVAAVLSALWFLFAAREAIFVFILAIFLAYMIAPVVDFVVRRGPRKLPRWAALALVYVVLIGLLIAAIMSIGWRVADQAAALASRVPQMLQDKTAKLPLPNWLEEFRPVIETQVRTQVGSLAEYTLPALQSAGKSLLIGLAHLLYIVLLPILSFFFLLDAEGMRGNLVELFSSPTRQIKLDRVLEEVHVLLGHYIRALFGLASAAFIFYTLFFEITGVPYALLLALMAGLFEFIPVAGPLAGATIATAVAAFSGYQHWGWMVVFFIVYRLFQDYIIQPYLMSSGVELHPIAVLFGVLAGEQIAGVPGMLLSVPVMAIFRILWRFAVRG